MYKIIKAPTKRYLEIQQQHRLLMAYANVDEANKTVTEQFSPIVCRDFLGDVLFAEENKTKISIYHFKYDPEFQKIDRNYLHLLLSDNFRKEMEGNLPLLHQMEARNGLKKTELIPLEKHLLVKADPFWLKAVWLMSAYTLCLKLMTFPDMTKVKETRTREGDYLRSMGEKFYKLMSYLREVAAASNTVVGKQVYDDDEGVVEVHENCGVVAVVTGRSRCAYAKKFAELEPKIPVE